MGFSKTFAATAVLSTLIPNALALNVDSKTNVAVYYGQGANQPRLSHFCQESSVDIINIGFINVFPEAVGDWPGSNFGNQCDGNVYENTELLSGCHQIWEDIPVCKELGKTVMLSLGGETAYQTIASDEVAEWFADFLWYSFGPPGQNSSFPRPFQDNQVDGFDFDIEHDGGYGYATMIRRLRSHFADFPDETFYISGAPQCQLPDAQLSDAISNSEFDFIWVQWYNTAGCSAMNFVEGTGLFNFAEWSEVIKHSANPNAKLFVGLPASESAAVDGFYLTPAEVYPLVDIYMNLYPDLFGGIMLWEATASDNNVINGHDYAQHMKHILHKCDPSPPQTSTSTVFVTPTPTPTSSTPSSSAVHTSSSSSQTASSQSSSSIASSSSSLSSSVDSTTAPPHSSTPVVSSSSLTGSSTTPIASSSVSSTSSASSHGISSSTPVASGSSSVKPTVTPSETPSSSGSGTTTQSGTSSSPASHTSSSAGHSSSSTPVKPNHTASETVRTSTTPIVSTSISSTESFATESTSTNTVDSSSSSISRVPSRTPITRTPVSSSPSATGTHASSTRRPLTTDSSSRTTTDSAASSSSTGSSENSSNGGNVSTGKPAPSGSESSTASHPANNGGESTTSTLSNGGSTATGAESSTGVQPTGNGSNSGTAPVVTASPSVTSIATTTKAPTVTTIIVTSYTDICPTGFTTITTTITTTFCPEATATAGVTNHPSRPASTTPSIPEGWTTTVKVCDNCAPTPTTVTLTLPNPTETAVPSLETSAIDIVTKTWTTTVTFCKHCGVTGSLITKTVPYTPAISTATAVETPGTAETPGTVETPGSPSGQGHVTIPVEVPRPTAGNTQVVVPSHRPSSSWVHVSGGIHSPTHTPTFKVHASTTSTVQNSAPTGNAGGVSPTFNAAGSRSSLMNLFGISIAAVFSLCILI